VRRKAVGAVGIEQAVEAELRRRLVALGTIDERDWLVVGPGGLSCAVVRRGRVTKRLTAPYI
jgi:hypothetical protein